MEKDEFIMRKNSILKLLQSKQNDEAYTSIEKKILGKILISSANAEQATRLPLFVEKLTKDVFLTPLNRYIYIAISDFIKSDKGTIDLTLLENKIKSDKNAAELYKKEGGVNYINSLVKVSGGTFSALPDLIKDINQMKTQRDLIENTVTFLNEIDNVSDPLQLETVLVEIGRKLSALNNSTENGSQPFKVIVEDWNNLLYEQRLSNGENGTQLGYERLDKKLGGLREWQFVVLGARPGTGKTAFTLNLVQNIVKKDENKHVLMFSLEMGSFELMERIVAMNTGINSRFIKTGELNDAQWADIATYLNNNSNSTSFYINDNPGVSINDIETEMNKVMEQTDSLDLVVIDYLQLINVNGIADRQQAIAALSRRIKLLSKKYHVPILALSQLNRSAATGERPGLHNLRESGQIEQDADIVMMLSQKDVEDEEESDEGEQDNEYSTITQIVCDIVKNRSGESGPTQFIFHKDISYFREMTDEELLKQEEEEKETNDTVNVEKTVNIDDILQ